MLHKENMAIMRMHRWPIWPCFFTHSIFSIKNLLKYDVDGKGIFIWEYTYVVFNS